MDRSDGRVSRRSRSEGEAAIAVPIVLRPSATSAAKSVSDSRVLLQCVAKMARMRNLINNRRGQRGLPSVEGGGGMFGGRGR